MRSTTFLFTAIAGLALLLGCGGSPDVKPAVDAQPPVVDPEPAPSMQPAPAPILPGQIDHGAPLPGDPQLHRGRLDNGLAWYVRENHRPEQRAALFLVVGAGSVDEDDDQRGLAHMVEHMAFNGTEEFPRQQLVDYLESIGMAFGPEVNAFTSLDQTVYMLQVPTDEPALLDTGLRILENWAQRVTFADEEIDKERGVIIEEWRSGLGAAERIFDAEMPVVFHGSKYAERRTIGDMDVIRDHAYGTIRRYYHDWYRPDLQAVVAVGDFTAGEMIARIEELFGAIPAREDPRPRENPPVPLDHAPLARVTTDAEATRTTVDVMWKHAPDTAATVADLDDQLTLDLALDMLRQRLAERAQEADPPFAMAFGGDRRQVRTMSALTFTAITEEGKAMRALEALATELARVRRHGFTTGELERARARTLRQLERQVQEGDKTESRRWAFRYMRHALYGGPLLGAEASLQYGRQLLPRISPDAVSSALSARLAGGGQVVTVSGPEKPGLVWPDEQELLDTFAAAMTRDVAPYTDAAVDAPLVADAPAPVDIVARGENPQLGTTTWTLANGVRVVIRPTDFKNDEVLMSAHAPGGTSRLESPAALDRAGMADFVISRSGVGAFDNVALEKKLAGQVVSCAPSIGEHVDGFRGRASPRDLATLCQLVHLYATAPREDADAFAAARAMLRSWLANRAADPENALRDTVQVRTANGDPRQRPFTADDIATMDLAAMHDFYREVYGDCDDFTFLFVGNVDLDALEPLARTWLGNLPGSPRDDRALDHSWPLPAGIVEDVVRAGLEPKSRVQIVFQGEAPWSDGAEYALESLLDCLRIRLRQVVREEKSGTYGVRVGGGWRTIPRDRWRVDIGWGCEPDRVAELTAAVWSVIEELQTAGPDAETLAKVRQTQTRAHETDLQSNRYWLRALERHQRRGTDPHAMLARPDEIAALDVVMVREAARRYLTHDEYVEVVLRPEGDAP